MNVRGRVSLTYLNEKPTSHIQTLDGNVYENTPESSKRHEYIHNAEQLRKKYEGQIASYINSKTYFTKTEEANEVDISHSNKRKTFLLEYLEKGMMSLALVNSESTRSTLNSWKKHAKNFEDMMALIDNFWVDCAEKVLDAFIRTGHYNATIFYLQRKGKDRGWAIETKDESHGEEVTLAGYKKPTDSNKYTKDELRGFISIFAKQLFADKVTCGFSDMHLDLFGELFQNSAVVCPRGHGKTTILCTILPIFLALETNIKYILIFQSTQQKMRLQMESIRSEFERNEYLIAKYGNQIGDEWRKDAFELANGTFIQGASRGTSIRGMHHKNTRPDYIILDDLYNDDNQKNTDIIAEVSEWFDTSVYPMADDPEQCVFKVIGTKFHRSDIFTTLSRKDTFSYSFYKALQEDGTALWKQKFTTDKLLAIKDQMGTLIFNQEYQGIPVTEHNAQIKKEWLIQGTVDPNDDRPYLKICTIDPAISIKTTADYTAVVWGRSYDDKTMYVEGIWQDKKSWTDVLSFLEDLHSEIDFDKIYVESESGFKAYYLELKRRGELPVKAITSGSKDKLTRLATASSTFEKKRIFFNEDMDERIKKTAFEQLLDFPNSKNDDIVDAIVYFVQACKKHAGV